MTTLITLKKIVAGEPQTLINIKLRYNSLASKFNEQKDKLSSKDKKQLLVSLDKLHKDLYITPVCQRNLY